MSEMQSSTPLETSEHDIPEELLAEAEKHLGEEVTEQTVEVSTSETSDESDVEKITTSETVRVIDDYKAERGSTQGLSMEDLVENGFDPDMILRKLGNERLDEKLEIVSGRYGAKRGTEEWKRLEETEARYIPMSDDEVDALLDAGADPQLIVDALQRTEPKDGVDNPSSARIAERMDRLVEVGLPPAILAARLNPSWRAAVKDKLAESEEKWRKANRLKAVA